MNQQNPNMNRRNSLMDPKRSTQIQVYMVVWGRTQCRKCSGLICVSSAPHGNASYLLFSRKIFLTYTSFSGTRFLFFIWIRSDHCLALPVSHPISLLLTDVVETWLMWRWQILNWIVAFFNVVTWICQICYMDLSNLLHGFVKAVTEFLTLFFLCSLNPLRSKMYSSFSFSCYCFVPKTKKRSKNYACYATFVSLRSFFIVFVCKSPGIVSVRKKERPSSSSSSHGRFVTLSVFLRLFAYNFSQPLCTFSKMIFLTGKLSQE